MPATQRGSAYKLGPKRWGVRYRDESGQLKRKSGFTSRTEALDWYRDVERPRRLGLTVQPTDETVSEFVERFLTSHAVGREPSTIKTLRERLRYATADFGDVKLRELEHRSAEIANWTAKLPERSRWHIVKAFRQALDVAVRWRLLNTNPAKLAGPNPEPKRAEIVPFTPDELDRIAAELETWTPLVVFAAETGLRPSEWIALERRDVDVTGRILLVERSFAYGRLATHGKTARSRRRVPLSSRAIAVLEELPRRIDTRLLFPDSKGGYLNLHEWRSREWEPAVEAAGLYACPQCGETAKRPPKSRGPRRCDRCGVEVASRRIYDLRHTFATRALAAGLGLYELARYMGTSVEQIDQTYGHLVQGAELAAGEKLDAYERQLEEARASAERGE